MVVEFRFGFGSCLVHFVCSNVCISGIYYYTRREVSESHRVHFVYGLCIGLKLLIVLWGVTHAAFLQLLV